MTKRVPRPTIAITGANGFLGSALVDHFASKGWQVVALVRQPDQFPPSPHTAYVEYSLTKPLPSAILRNVDYLVHTAYIQQAKGVDALTLNITGAKALLQASRSHNIKRNVFISSMSAHDQAVSAYGRQKLAIEKLFNTSADVSLRPGLIIGNGGIVAKMAGFMKTRHMVPIIDGGQQPLQVIYIKDLVMAIEQALLEQTQNVLTVANPRVYTYKRFYQQLARRLKVRVVFIPVPFILLLLILKLVRFLHVPVNFNEDNLLGLKHLRSVNTETDLAKLILKPVSLTTALRRTSFD